MRSEPESETVRGREGDREEWEGELTQCREDTHCRAANSEGGQTAGDAGGRKRLLH